MELGGPSILCQNPKDPQKRNVFAKERERTQTLADLISKCTTENCKVSKKKKKGKKDAKKTTGKSGSKSKGAVGTCFIWCEVVSLPCRHCLSVNGNSSVTAVVVDIDIICLVVRILSLCPPRPFQEFTSAFNPESFFTLALVFQMEKEKFPTQLLKISLI
jgi:hypothetical protein